MDRLQQEAAAAAAAAAAAVAERATAAALAGAERADMISELRALRAAAGIGDDGEELEEGDPAWALDATAVTVSGRDASALTARLVKATKAADAGKRIAAEVGCARHATRLRDLGTGCSF